MLLKFLLLVISVIVVIFGIFLMVNNIFTSQKQEHQVETNDSTSNTLQNAETETVVWVPYWDQERAYESIRQNSKSIDAIGLFWYKLTQDGQIELYPGATEDHRIVEFAHGNDIKVYGLIANLSDETDTTDNWDSTRVERVITNPQEREKHITDLVNLVMFKNFDGLALDYESLDPDLRNPYTDFVRELSEELHKNKKSLEVAIHPKNSDDPDTQFSGAIAQDYQALSQYADKLHFMMYTQHDTSASPGPSSTIEWNESVLNFAIEEEKVPNEKIALGIGIVGAHWVTDPSNERRIRGTTADLTYQDIEQIASNTQHELVRDETSQSLMMTFVDQDGYNIIWFNDAKSVKRKLRIAEEYNIPTVSLWRGGGEDSSLWDEL